MLPYSGVVVGLTVEALIGQRMYHTQFAELTFSVPWMLVYFGWQPRSIGELRTGKTRRKGLKMYGVAKSLIEGYYRPVCDMAYISPQNLESPYAGTLSFHSLPLPTTYYLTYRPYVLRTFFRVPCSSCGRRRPRLPSFLGQSNIQCILSPPPRLFGLNWT